MKLRRQTSNLKKQQQNNNKTTEKQACKTLCIAYMENKDELEPRWLQTIQPSDISLKTECGSNVRLTSEKPIQAFD